MWGPGGTIAHLLLSATVLEAGPLSGLRLVICPVNHLMSEACVLMKLLQPAQEWKATGRHCAGLWEPGISRGSFLGHIKQLRVLTQQLRLRLARAASHCHPKAGTAPPAIDWWFVLGIQVSP